MSEVRQVGRSGEWHFAVCGADTKEAALMSFQTETGISTEKVFRDKRSSKEFNVNYISVHHRAGTKWRVAVGLTELKLPGDFEPTLFPDD